ncbi:hypothetical protein HX057_04315 [Myroides odoratimimus]|uniref:Uncharacterized protein n=1 Tax=Myroides odoratimimus CIP 101113 TaxID=883154 RepID=A0AAV3F332_9FLAO|nr:MULTISPECIES: hypothetical protein [Myroides]EHO12436.1 hypothetical protein HMPREF9715_01591 [Myroides odoratimimus CIP 101113]MCA4793172.1 hypothetical protein [Myroides odoratimimus]MCA4820426.1 hypothetical protein [Myroides odoratimimus]MDM1064890.1 hypothetical protein [Myroides odoratimimus]MDM1085466.1 hypothetical protein [Myroides odoratimimus]
MENANALKLIKKIQSDLISDGLVVENIVADLQKLREFALLEEKPVLVKSIRLAYEHIQNNKAFLIAIPSDEPIEEEGEEGATAVEKESKNDLESLQYLLSLYKDINNKHNLEDLKDYNNRLLAF